ncbi:dTDP-4-dehydrorhamnose 3,5-epimerase [Rhodovarius sp.]|uniref:dTDP-4-dehydrorhamnose 3,5-epimerase n=1 Tax=Rhodovarius sp. TaxID=2972673 RepID=UPI0034A0FDCD
MNLARFDIAGPVLIEPRRFADSRGFFSEVWKASIHAEIGITSSFVQDNHSLSRLKGTVRGLHFQRPPTAQGKLVRCVRGAIFDVAVDIRPGSPSFGKFITAELSAENWLQLWIPPGFAHGLCTLTEDTEVLYKVDAPYDPATDSAIRFDDPAIAIPWPVAPGQALLSEKDRAAPLLAEAALPEAW